MNKVEFTFEVTSDRNGEQTVQSAGTDVFVTGRTHKMGVTTRLVDKDTGGGHPSWDKIKGMRDQRLAQLCAALAVGTVSDTGLDMAQFGWADDGGEAAYDIVDTFEKAVGTACAIFVKTSIRKDKQKKPVLNSDGKPFRDSEVIQVATPGQLVALNAEKENDDG